MVWHGCCFKALNYCSRWLHDMCGGHQLVRYNVTAAGACEVHAPCIFLRAMLGLLMSQACQAYVQLPLLMVSSGPSIAGGGL